MSLLVKELYKKYGQIDRQGDAYTGIPPYTLYAGVLKDCADI